MSSSVGGLHDHFGIAVGHALMPDAATPGGFVPVIATEEVPPGR